MDCTKTVFLWSYRNVSEFTVTGNGKQYGREAIVIIMHLVSIQWTTPFKQTMSKRVSAETEQTWVAEKYTKQNPTKN